MKQCPECDENLADDAVHCGHCGARVEEGDDGGEKKTMFGLGTISDEDLEEAAEEAKGDSSEAGGDSGDGSGSSRLTRPGETDAGGQTAESAETDTGPEAGDGGARLGLTDPDADSGSSALAETEAMPAVDDESGESREADSQLEGGRLSNPASGEEPESELEDSASPGSDSTPPGQGDSAFVSSAEPKQSGVDRSTQGDGRPRPDGPGQWSEQTSDEAGSETTPDPSVRGPEAETEPADTPLPGAESAGDVGSSETAGGVEADGASPPGEGPGVDSARAGMDAETDTPGGPEPSVGSSTSVETGPEPSVGSSTTADAEPETQGRRASAPSTAETAPPEEQVDADLSDDDRFGGGDLEKNAESSQPAKQGGDDEGLDKKTLLIVGGILTASAFMCGAAVLLMGFLWT
jgi:hypothetical protein